MHYSNYISAHEATRCIRDGAKSISLTPTALKQTRDTTIELLRKNGIKVKEVESSGRPRKLGEADIKKVITIRHSGVSLYKISNLMKIPKSTVFDYCRRYDGAKIKEHDIKDISIEESRRIFDELLKKDLDDEVNDLAKRGLMSSDTKEIEDILREIEIILYS